MARKAKYRSDNEEKLKASRAVWLDSNREWSKEYGRAYAKENPEKGRAARSKRRAVELNAKPCWYGELDDFVMREAAHLCLLREVATGLAWHVDHLIPLQAQDACGLHCYSNIQVIPACINQSKRNRMKYTEPLEWLGNGK